MKCYLWAIQHWLMKDKTENSRYLPITLRTTGSKPESDLSIKIKLTDQTQSKVKILSLNQTVTKSKRQTPIHKMHT